MSEQNPETDAQGQVQEPGVGSPSMSEADQAPEQSEAPAAEAAAAEADAVEAPEQAEAPATEPPEQTEAPAVEAEAVEQAEAPEQSEAPAAEVPEQAEAVAPEAEAVAEEAAEEPSVSTQVEEGGPCVRLVKVQVPTVLVAREIEKSYAELGKTVFIKGFRRNHVPRHVLERRFGEQVLDGVKQTLVDDGFKEATEGHSLRPALPPEIDYKKIELKPGEPLSFEVRLEVVPDFTIDNYKGLAVERPHVEVTPENVDQALEGFRLRHGEYQTLQEGEVGEKDVPMCHAIAIENGEEVWRGSELSASLAGEAVGGLHVEGLKAALLGAKVGETKTFHTTVPETFRAEEVRGKEVDLEVTVDELRRFEAPEVTDEWARSLHFEDLEDLREELYDELRRQREQEADDLVHQRVGEQLLSLTDFEVPEGLVERIVERAKDRERLELLYRGTPQDEIDKAVEEQAARVRQSSVRQCKLYFIYEKLAEQEKLFVTEDELQQRIQAIALNYRRRPEEVQGELEREGRLNSLRQQMREEKVRDFLVQHANVTEAAAPSREAPAEEKPAAAGEGEGAAS